MSYFVFVYGSLKKGFGNHDFLEGSTFVGEFTTTDNNYLMVAQGASFPLCYKGNYPDSAKVLGEVYEIDDLTLADLDMLEGHPVFYNRRNVKLDGFEHEVFMYLNHPYDYDKSPHIPKTNDVYEWKKSP